MGRRGKGACKRQQQVPRWPRSLRTRRCSRSARTCWSSPWKRASRSATVAGGLLSWPRSCRASLVQRSGDSSSVASGACSIVQQPRPASDSSQGGTPSRRAARPWPAAAEPLAIEPGPQVHPRVQRCQGQGQGQGHTPQPMAPWALGPIGAQPSPTTQPQSIQRQGEPGFPKAWLNPCPWQGLGRGHDSAPLA